MPPSFSSTSKKVREVLTSETFLLCLFILVSIGVSRFLYLGYSEYISDELTSFLQPGGDSIFHFLITRRKGPMQFLVSFIPFIFTRNFSNEFAERLPFAFANTLSFVFLFLFVKKITKNIYAAFFSAMIAGANGLTTALGRIVQYQSLNMLFSFISLFFFSDLLYEGKKHQGSAFLGSIFFMLSFLSHWDALYVLPIILAIFMKYSFSKLSDKKNVLVLSVLGILVFSFFIIPFFASYLSRTSDLSYMGSRIGFSSFDSFEINIERFRLYNPFFVLEVYLVILVLGVLCDVFIRRKDRYLPGIFSLWFIICMIVFLFLIRSAGTHIYNLVFPISILGGITIGTMFNIAPRLLKPVLFLILLPGLAALYYQTYVVIVDHKIEYPWKQEYIFGRLTQEYSHKDPVVQNNLIGFPLRRNWKNVNEIVNNLNKNNKESLGYITNESKQISKFYMDAEYSGSRPFYAIGIKRPSTFINDYYFSQIKGKKTVNMLEIKGENLVRIYRVD